MLTKIRFTVRDKGGSLGGQTIEGHIPEFHWESFKQTPNAEAFVKKAYVAAARKLIRELREEKNFMQEYHLESTEQIVARSIKFSKAEIKDWCASRDWTKATFKNDPSKGIQTLTEKLPKLATSESVFVFNPDEGQKVALMIADVSDLKADPVADYIFAKLTGTFDPLSLI